MKVICIDDKIEQIPDSIYVPAISFLQVLTVMSEGYERDLKEYYTFHETGYRYGYSKIHFAPLSEIETELVNKKEEMWA
jgi:hypothetical protein